MAKRILTSFDIIIQAGLSNPKNGYVGLGAKSDGLYFKIGSSERKILTDNDLTSLVTTNTSQTIFGQKTFSTTTTFNSSINHRGSLIDSSIVAPLNSSRRQGLYFQNNSSYLNFYLNNRDGRTLCKLSHTTTTKFFELPDTDIKVRIGRPGSYLPQHMLVVNGSALFENEVTVNNVFRFGNTGWSVYVSGDLIFAYGGVTKFTISTSGRTGLGSV